MVKVRYNFVPSGLSVLWVDPHLHSQDIPFCLSPFVPRMVFDDFTPQSALVYMSIDFGRSDALMT